MKAREELLDILEDIHARQHKRLYVKYCALGIVIILIHMPLIIKLFN